MKNAIIYKGIQGKAEINTNEIIVHNSSLFKYFSATLKRHTVTVARRSYHVE